MTEEQVICVLGMHRSGSSLIARILNLLGVYLGPEEHLVKPREDNPKGFWEHQQIVDLNDEILMRLGGNLYDPPEFRAGWEYSAQFEDLRHRAQAILQRDFEQAKVWGWKDPRTCLTLPFWRQLVPLMRYVICLRNPLDVALSLQRRNGFSLEEGSWLWLKYVTASIQHTAGQPRHWVWYEDAMQNPEKIISQLAQFLRKSKELDRNHIASILKCVDSNLCHHRTSVIDVINSAHIPFPAKALYATLRVYAPLLTLGEGEAEDIILSLALQAEREVGMYRPNFTRRFLKLTSQFNRNRFKTLLQYIRSGNISPILRYVWIELKLLWRPKRAP